MVGYCRDVASYRLENLMSGVFFITPYDPKDWQDHNIGEVPQIFLIDIQIFGAELRKSWPDAEIRFPAPDDSVTIYWDLSPAGLSGSLFPDHQTLTIVRGIQQNLVEFINWYRLFIPSQHKLYLFRDYSFERLV